MLAATQQRLNIILDTRIPLEAMILNRLQRLPQQRRNDWLRGLLLTGFNTECQVIKSQTPSIPQQEGGTDDRRFLHWRMPAMRSGARRSNSDASSGSGDQHRVGKAQSNPSTDSDKPFAQLKNVIGH
jgi:hypothetical protein